MNTNKRKFDVSIKVDGRLTVSVEAENADEAFKLATAAFMEDDLSSLEIVDAENVNAYDVENEIYTDAN